MKSTHKKFAPFDPCMQLFMTNDDLGSSTPPSRDPVVTAAKYGQDVGAMARHIDKLEGENWQYREDKRTLNEKIKDLEKGKPAEGTVVLSPEDAKLWEAYKAHGKPEDIEKIKGENQRLSNESKENERKGLMSKICEAPTPGVKFDTEVFADLDSRLSGTKSYEKKQVTVDGEKVDQWYVKYTEGEGSSATTKESSVLDFYAEKFPKYLDALKSESSPGGGTPYPEQVPGGTNQKPTSDPGAVYVASRYGHNTGKAATQ